MQRSGAVVLAAGASRRMGRPKALLALDGETFLARVVASARAAGAAPVVLVGRAELELADAARAAGALLRDNPRPERGMLSSLQVGLEGLGAVAGSLVWPVDHPAASAATARALLEAGHGAGRVVRPRLGGRGGHPIYLPARLFPAVRALAPDTPSGLRALLAPLRAEELVVEVDDPGVLADVDRPEDHEALLRAWRRDG